MSDRELRVTFFLSVALAVLAFFVSSLAGCATVDPRLDPETARCDALASQYRLIGGLATGATALGGAGIAPTALVRDEEPRLGFGISAAVLVAAGLALRFVADDVESSWVDACESARADRTDGAETSSTAGARD